MMEHPFLIEEQCRRHAAERLAEADRAALLAEAGQAAHHAPKPGLRLHAAKLLHALITLI